MKNAKRRYPLITRIDIVGWLFVLPFLIGFVFMFMKPMLSSIVYSFNKVSYDANGMVLKPVGWENYDYALFGDAKFFKALLTIGGEVAVKIIVIMFMSMFVAMLLNQRFPGRLLFRTAMFLPVIFGADQIMSMFESSYAYSSMDSTSNAFLALDGSAKAFISDLVNQFGFLSGLMSLFSSYANQLFDLTWEIGIQIVLFIVGFQSIPSYLYEVCDIEGATKWETFWKITFPLLSPTMLLCLIYTVVDNFNSNNEVVKMINGNVSSIIHYACAQTWLYAIIVFAVVMVVYAIVSRWTIYLD